MHCGGEVAVQSRWAVVVVLKLENSDQEVDPEAPGTHASGVYPASFIPLWVAVMPLDDSYSQSVATTLAPTLAAAIPTAPPPPPPTTTTYEELLPC